MQYDIYFLLTRLHTTESKVASLENGKISSDSKIAALERDNKSLKSDIKFLKSRVGTTEDLLED